MKLIEDKELTEKDEYFNRYLTRAKSDFIDRDYDSCLTKIRTCLEEVFCYIIEKTGNKVEKNGDMSKMATQARNILHLNTDKEINQRLKQQLQGIVSIIDSISSLRNIASDAHGVGSNRRHLNASQIVLCLNSSITLKEYFLSVLAEQLKENQTALVVSTSGVDKIKENTLALNVKEEPVEELGLFDSLALIEEAGTSINIESAHYKQYTDEFITRVNEKSEKIKTLKANTNKPSLINIEYKLLAEDMKAYTKKLEQTTTIIINQWKNCYLASKVILLNPFMTIGEKENYVKSMTIIKESMKNSVLQITAQAKTLDLVKGLNSQLTSEINKLQNEMQNLSTQFKTIVGNVEEIEQIKIK